MHRHPEPCATQQLLHFQNGVLQVHVARVANGAHQTHDMAMLIVVSLTGASGSTVTHTRSRRVLTNLSEHGRATRQRDVGEDNLPKYRRVAQRISAGTTRGSNGTA